MSADYAKQTKAIIAEHLGVSLDRLDAQASLVDSLGADSLDKIEIGMTLEDEFGLDFSDEAIVALDKVGDVVDLVKDKLAERIVRSGQR